MAHPSLFVQSDQYREVPLGRPPYCLENGAQGVIRQGPGGAGGRLIATAGTGPLADGMPEFGQRPESVQERESMNRFLGTPRRRYAGPLPIDEGLRLFRPTHGSDE